MSCLSDAAVALRHLSGSLVTELELYGGGFLLNTCVQMCCAFIPHRHTNFIVQNFHIIPEESQTPPQPLQCLSVTIFCLVHASGLESSQETVYYSLLSSLRLKKKVGEKIITLVCLFSSQFSHYPNAKQ